MPQTFHPFCRLPPELRYMIWELAIRPNHPGAHFLTIYGVQEVKRLSDEYIIRSSCRLWHSYLVTAPKWVPRYIDANLNGRLGEDVITSWICNNPSAYLIDGSLWTTCRESRLVIKRQFNIQKWKTVQEESMVPSTGYLADYDSTYRYFVAFPQQDLFCVQPHNFQNTNHGMIENGFSMILSYYGFNAVKNIAFEFDPAWETSQQSPGYAQLDMTDYFYRGLPLNYEFETVWFIDYSIKRRHHVPTKKQAERSDGTVFYGSDCRFVEVARDDLKDYPWEGVLDAQGDGLTSCFKFLKELELRIQNAWFYGRRENPVKLGVLACEYF
ncbi:hypothetical protein F4776DRAFT_670900 [Hypoxylon sp. NC0597]|nr:hypothetical protein F4776DRAFT_670900 [Hypoxylon sp. NC0597]